MTAGEPMECQAGPESDPCGGGEFELSYGDTGIIVAACRKCGTVYKLVPVEYRVEVAQKAKRMAKTKKK